MSDNVVDFTGKTVVEGSPDQVLKHAIGQIEEVAIVIGTDRNGELYFASSTSAAADISWQIERAKQLLYRTAGI